MRTKISSRTPTRDNNLRIVVVSLDEARRHAAATRLHRCASSVEEIATAVQWSHRPAVDAPTLLLFTPCPTIKNFAALETEFLALYRLISSKVAIATLTLRTSSIVNEVALALGIPLIFDREGLNLCEALRRVMNMPRRETAIAAHAHAEKRLSRREAAILVSLRAGLSLKEVAHNLGISANTASTYKSRIMAKLHIQSNAQLLSESSGADVESRRS